LTYQTVGIARWNGETILSFELN